MDRIRRLELFVRAVDTGSFAKAAASFEITPSGVSRAIAELEKQLGVALFHRTTRHLVVTEEGSELYQRGREILEKLDEVVGRSFAIRDKRRAFDLIPLPHPSGASPWHRIPPGLGLLGKAMRRIARHPAMRTLSAQ